MYTASQGKHKTCYNFSSFYLDILYKPMTKIDTHMKELKITEYVILTVLQHLHDVFFYQWEHHFTT